MKTTQLSQFDSLSALIEKYKNILEQSNSITQVDSSSLSVQHRLQIEGKIQAVENEVAHVVEELKTTTGKLIEELTQEIGLSLQVEQKLQKDTDEQVLLLKQIMNKIN